MSAQTIFWIAILSVLIIGDNSAIWTNYAFIMNRKKGRTRNEFEFIVLE